MINFRFHLVSLVSVFLALALGVVMGSTVIDRAIVDGLRSRIDQVERNAEARRAENVELESRLDTLQAYVEQAVPLMVGGRLDGVAVALAAVRGVDDETVKSTAETLRDGGAAVPGVLWIEPRFGLGEPADEVELREALGSDRRGTELQQAAVEALGRRLAYGPQALPGADPLGPAEDLLVALRSAGFVGFDTSGGGDVDLASYPPAGARVLVVDGPAGAVQPAVGSLPLVRVAALAGAPVALGEVFQESATGSGRGGVVRLVREDEELAALVATVDDVEDIRGRAALAVALEELGRGRAGHYGVGPGASRQLPEVPAATATASGR